MSQDTGRLSATELAEALALRVYTPNAFMHRLAREVQELRHLRDNVLPDLRQELDNANAALAASRKALADIYATHRPEWVSDAARIAGKEPWCCAFCGTADGAWPCETRIIAAEALGVEP